MKFKQSFFRRISPIFLAAVVLVSSLCVVPVSAASTASNASSTLVPGSFSEASDGYYQISGTWVFNEYVSLPSDSVDFYDSPDPSRRTPVFFHLLDDDRDLACFDSTSILGVQRLYSLEVTFFDGGFYSGDRFVLSEGLAVDSVDLVKMLPACRYFVFDVEAFVSSYDFEWLSRNATPYVDLEAAAHEKTNSLLADIGTFFDFVLNMVGEVVAIVIDTPLLLLSVVITLCGIGIVFFKRLI